MMNQACKSLVMRIVPAIVFALGLATQGLAPPSALAQQSGPVSSLETFNRAAIQGDLDTVQALLTRRFLHETSFVEEKASNPAQLKRDVKLLSFYQVLNQESISGSAVRVKVVQQRLVGRLELITRWYYLVREDNRWKLDRVGPEEPYR
jgi:hypothetical protein